MIAKDMSTKKGMIKHILREYAETRDCDMKLTARVWHLECHTKQMDITKLLHHVFNANRLTSPTTIIRVRRILQKEDCTLRGKKYKTRSVELEQDVREWVRDENNKNGRS